MIVVVMKLGSVNVNSSSCSNRSTSSVVSVLMVATYCDNSRDVV